MAVLHRYGEMYIFRVIERTLHTLTAYVYKSC
jgi:hypothetical protein